jgi:excisionase family DNA binding protein
MNRLMSIKELAEYLQLNKFTVYRMVQKGKIPCLKISKQWRFKKEEIDKWLETQRKSKFKTKR